MSEMPRKRKSLSTSPQRRVSICGSSSLPSSSTHLPLPPAMSNSKEEVFRNMCEMFPDLDPSLVEMVLSEYKEVETVMDYLLELSTSAKGNTQDSMDFAKIASFLDDFQTESHGPNNFEDVPNQIEEQQDAFCMVENAGSDLDALLDEALDRYGLNNAELFSSPEQYEDTMHHLVKPESDEHNSSFPTDHTTLNDLSKEDFQREDYTCALDPDFAACQYEAGTSLYEAGTSLYEAGTSLGVTETDGLANIESYHTIASDVVIGSPDCSKQEAMYSQESVEKPTEVDQQCTGPISTASHVNLPSASPKSQTKWNPMASSFYPVSNVNPSFIAPIAVNPSPWTWREPIAGGCYNLSPSLPFIWNFNRFSQNHWTTENIKPINKAECAPQIAKKVTPFVGKVLVLLRGAPGSGKSTLARLLLEQNPTGVILSTDDYFSLNGEYQYDVNCLGEAHEWNHKRAKDAFEKNVSPIIIDNTNLQGWEMKPYVSMAVKHKYKVTFREPDTWWKCKPKELERRNHHGVKKEKIIRMLESYERVTVNSILNLSHPKSSKNADNSQRKTAEKNGELNVLPPSLKEETSFCKTPELENMADTGRAGPATHWSCEVSIDGPEVFPDAAESQLKSLPTAENENSTEVNQLVHTLSTDGATDDMSIESAIDQQGPDIYSEPSLLDERPELLSFVGDWPIEKTMSQRAPRSRKARARPGKHKYNSSVQDNGENYKADPDVEQIDKTIDHEQVDSGSSDQDQLEEAVDLIIEHLIDDSTVNSDGEDYLLGLENQLYTQLMLHNNEDSAEDEDNSEGMVIDKVPEVQEKVADGTYVEDVQSTSSVNEEVKLKPRQPRRNCRQCKLALSFTNNYTISSKLEESEFLQQPSVDLCKFSQTEPQDFALAWRLERKNIDVLDSAKIIIGKSSRFISKSPDGGSGVLESIPYRVMQHKSTFVEEDDMISLGDQDSLEILCKLFRSLSFDVLKDLFERCNNDLEWTTNLLLDAGEKMYKDEEYESEEWEDLESCSHSDKDSRSSISEEKSVLVTEEYPENVETNFLDDSFKAFEYSPFVNELPLVVAEELKNGNVLSSNEINFSHQCMLSSELQELFPNHETITNSISSDLMWPSDVETEHPNIPHSPADILESIHHSSPSILEGIHHSSSSILEGIHHSSSNILEGIHHSSSNILESDDTLKTITKGNTEELNLTNTNLSKKSDSQPSEILEDENNEEQELTEVTAFVEEENKMQNKSNSRSNFKESLQFHYLELSLPPEFAFQLTELFGPVGIDPGSLTIEDCVVPIDLKLAECIHKKWKESIMERHRQEALSYQLIFQEGLLDDPVDLDKIPQNLESGVSPRDADLFPFMDQWNTRTNKVSLRQIIAEEMAIQAHEDSKKSLSSKNCAVKLKEKQLLELFPNVEPQLLLDIFKENDYSLQKTEEFMSSVLEADPVQNVIARGFKQAVSTATEKNKDKKLKPDKEILNERFFQDSEFPNYDDFRAEAFLYHQRKQESYRKAAEAYNRGMKQVAAYYAQQGYLYGQKMKEENQRAAVRIFKTANEYLLPENILDLHGLHVDEAMKHLRKVLQDKVDEFKQNGGKSHLLVITGRGNHSQGGVPRIKPAVIDFLTNHDYRFQEKTPGVFRITLK